MIPPGFGSDGAAPSSYPLVVTVTPDTTGWPQEILSRNGMVCQDAYSGYTRVDVYADLIRAELGR